MPLPQLALVRRYGTHRLVPSRHLPRGEPLPGIGVEELVFGVPRAGVINAAFCHAHPLGGRFNGPDRGAWYASYEVATAQAEVAFHKTVELAEIDRFVDIVTYDDYLADSSASLHDLRVPDVEDCLDPDSYLASQALAERLLAAGSLGVVYPSVRSSGGTCVARVRPALVANVRVARTYRLTWDGSPEPTIDTPS
jgi:RES domain-containing protein